MRQFEAFTLGLLVFTLFVVKNVNARLPPSESRLSSESSTSFPADTSERPSIFNPDRDSMDGDRHDLDLELRQTLAMIRRFNDLFRNRFYQDPSQSFWPLLQMRPWLQMRPMFHTPSILDSSEENMDDSLSSHFFSEFKPSDPLSNGYKLVNETSFLVNGRKICQTTYEKVENKGYGVFSSRMITAKPCDNESKGDQGESSTNLPTSEKQGDNNSNKSDVEREEKPIAAGSVNSESPKTAIENSATTLSSKDKINSNDSSVENEISGKPKQSEPTITVNDGK